MARVIEESSLLKNASFISVSNLCKSFGRRKALDGVSFELKKGEFLSLFGPNGAGKTTLIKILSTLLLPSSGTITIDGVDLRKEPLKVREKIGLISHNSFLYGDLSAYENLLFYGRMYNVSNLEEKISEVLEKVELTHRKFDLVRVFSRGMLQRLAIARALLSKPQILLLDEPHSGLDPHATEIFDTILKDLKEKGHTLIMSTHNLSRGLNLATSVVILSEGKIVFSEKKSAIDLNEFDGLYNRYVRTYQ